MKQRGAYYNERDPFAAQWLRNLIAAGLIAPGDVDERSITEISANDLGGYTQCHFFAGIGVWSHALRRAGWPDDRPIWTGSCPCQPFSAAGKQAGFADERHLWPTWFDLISECGPTDVVGEQVASALDWLDLVSADLEGAGYAVAAADLCAAGFAGAHVRQRLYFAGVAHADRAGRRQAGRDPAGDLPPHGAGPGNWPRDASSHDGVAHAALDGRGKEHSDAGRCDPRDPAEGRPAGLDAGGNPCSLAVVDGAERPGTPMLGRHNADWLFCRDGKWRPVEPGTFPLADAPAGRVGRLRAYGNALDAETATQFLLAFKAAREAIGVAA